jgi:hypothetical protein
VAAFLLCMSAFEIQNEDLIEELQKKKRVEIFVGK